MRIKRRHRRIKEGRIKEGRIKEGRIKEGRIKEGRIKEGRIKEGRIKEDGVRWRFEENKEIFMVCSGNSMDDRYFPILRTGRNGFVGSFS